MKRSDSRRASATGTKHVTKQGMVASALRKAIVTGQLRGGQRLQLGEIAAQFNVSHMPVREALWTLHAEGLVIFQPHKGAIVTRLSAEEIQEALEIRSFLEGMAARYAVDNITPKDFDKLRELVEQIDVELDNPYEYFRLNIEFHNAIKKMAKKERLADLISNLRASTQHYMWTAVLIPEIRERAQAKHHEILEAFERRDRDGAERSLREHVLNGAKDMSDYFRNFNLP